MRQQGVRLQVLAAKSSVLRTEKLSLARQHESHSGLDYFAFFVAAIQTGFGPFLSVYLTTRKWTQVDIGMVLAVGSTVSLLGQVPGGWLVDWVRSKQRAAGVAIVAIGVSALLIAIAPVFAAIIVTKLMQVGASSVLGPAVAAITLGLVGHAAVGLRLGRNARFAAIGNGLAAGIMGACGYFVSAQSVFFVTAILAIPALLALARIREVDVDPIGADGGISGQQEERGIGRLLRNPALIILAACVALFHLANSAMLPLVGSNVTMRSSQWATALVAACIIAPQLVVAAASPTVGHLAQSWGRRPLLLFGFAALPLRGALLAWTNEPYAIVSVQALDGISGAVLGVLVPLAIADISRGTGHFNLAQGIVGSVGGVGATMSPLAAGVLADRFGMTTAFIGLAGVAALGFGFVLAAMPETRRANE
jgi:MFS family permease